MSESDLSLSLSLSLTHTHTHTCPTAENSLISEMHVDDLKTRHFLSALPLPQTTAHHRDEKTKHHPFSYSKHVTVILISRPQLALGPYTFILYSKCPL